MNIEYFPIPNKPIWLLFDLGNSHKPTKRYVVTAVFNTRKKAIKYRNWELKQGFGVNLSKPIKYIPAK